MFTQSQINQFHHDGTIIAKNLMSLIADVVSTFLLFEEAVADTLLSDFRKTLICNLYVERCKLFFI